MRYNATDEVGGAVIDGDTAVSRAEEVCGLKTYVVAGTGAGAWVDGSLRLRGGL